MEGEEFTQCKDCKQVGHWNQDEEDKDFMICECGGSTEITK